MPIFLWATLGTSCAYAQGVYIYMTTAGGETMIALGDSVTFQVSIDPHGAKLTGYEFYLTFNPAVFKPIFADIDTSISDEDTVIVYRPFTPGNLISLGPPINHTHGDEWSEPYVDLNDMPGFQLDYFQRTPAAPPSGQREYFSGSGIAATFDLVVIGMPDDPSGLARITFDNQYVVPGGGGRQTRYWLLGSGGEPSDFAFLTPYEILVAGLKILPAISDTAITPGDTLRIKLEDHFLSGMYAHDEVTWSIPSKTTPGGTDAYLDFSDTSLVVTSLGTDHCIVEVTVNVVSNDLLYSDSQPLRVIVDYPPVFDVALPSFTFDEDTQLPLAANADIGGVLFTDQDDSGPDITIWLEPDSPVHLSYDDVNTVTFYADTNRFGVYTRRLFVRDTLGISADTLLTFTVNPINDPPVVNFDSVSALGDTLVIHRATLYTLDLTPFVIDVDNAVLTWSVNNPDPTNLTATLLPGDLLRLEAGASSPFKDITLTLTATDDSLASDSDTLVVSIRSWPPEIIIVEDIRINSQDAPSYHLNLADWVDDPDTQPADMTWSFRALDAVTGTVDPYVAYSPGSSLTGDTVNISVTQVYSAIDLLEMTVTDDAYNTDIDTARLFIFDDDGPMIYPLPGLKVYRDSTLASIIDLDDYVADIKDDPEDISWTFTGGDSLESFYIDPYSHEVTISTNTTFIGNLTVSLVATNSRGLKDTSDLAILVSRLVDGPPLWYAVPDEVEVVYGWTTDLFNYGQICYDETPTDSIFFTSYCDTTLLTVTIASPDSVKLTTPILVKDSTTYLYFTAEDELGNVSSSDTITVRVKDSFSPVWQRIPTISLNVNETYSGLILWDYVSDRDTPDDSLTIEVMNLNSLIDVSYDSVTTELTVIAGSRTSDSQFIITATDPEGNSSFVKVRVIVISIPDETAPEGGLTYFFNPVADKWIHYVLVADSTTTWFNTTYIFNSQETDLVFTQRDSLPGTLTWFAPFHFEYAGTYNLSAVLADNADPVNNRQFALSLGVSFSKAMGDVLASPDRRLTVSYPAAPIPAGKLLIIAEDSMPELTGAPRGARWRRYAEAGYGLPVAGTARAQGPGTAKITRTGANKGKDTPVAAALYSLDTNLPEPILVTLAYHQNRDADPYYSFYEVDGDQLRKIETYTGADGQFEAAVTLGRDVIFASSDTPARNAPLPDAELFCYPNPFNSTIQVRFLLRREDRGRIVIYNLLGREVYASPRQPFELGVHAFSWHGIDNRGLLVPSGAYFIRLETDGGKVVTRKVTLLK